MRKTKKINNRILIIGSSLEALRAAELLADDGFEIVIVEKNSEIYTLKVNETGIRTDYISNSDIYDFNYINEIVIDLKKRKNIKVLTNAVLRGLHGKICNYEAILKVNGNTENIISDSIIFVPKLDGRYEQDNELSHNCISLLKFSELIENNDIGKLKSLLPENIVFYISSRSISRLNFSYVLDYADFCRTKLNIDVKIVTPQVLTAGIWQEIKYRQLREKGITFFKYDKEPGFTVDSDSGEVNVSLNKTDEGCSVESFKTNFFVFTEKLVWTDYDKKVGKILNLVEYENINFLSCKTPRKGIYLCGKGRDDILGYEALGDSNECFLSIRELFPNDCYTYESGVIEVDKNKCTLCLTCVRTCPHKAIEFEGYDLKERAVKIIEEACFRCGQCVSDCPTKALSYLDNG